MDALVDSSALEARLGRELTAEETARAAGLLADASARIRAFTGRDFTETPFDEVTVRADAGEIRLPKGPVTGVHSVVGVGYDGGVPQVTPVSGWSWDGLDRLSFGSVTVINAPEWWGEASSRAYRVTYSHGYAEVPADVVAVVCGMVLRSLLAPVNAGAIVSETVGPYSYRLADGANGTAVSLTADDQAVLKRYRRSAGTTRVRL